MSQTICNTPKHHYHRAHVVNNYVYFKDPNCKKHKLRIYKTRSNGTIKFCSKFDALWLLLLNTDDYIRPANVTNVIYNLPTNNATELTGHVTRDDGFVTWTSNTGFDGPITEDGLPLSLFQLGYTFKVIWEADQDVNISFYTSYDNLDDLAYLIIDSDNQLAQYHGIHGSFMMQNFDYFYTNVDKNVNLKLRVEIVIPPCPPEQFIPGIEYLDFSYKGIYYKFPVLETIISEDPSIIHIILDPAMIEIQKQIVNTLTILSKPWPETVIATQVARDIVTPDVPQILSYFNVYNMDQPTPGYKFKVRTYANTYNYIVNDVFERDYWWSMISRGSERGNPTLGISIKPEFRQSNILQIQFDIELVADPRWSPEFGIVVRPGFKIYTLNAGYEFCSFADFGREIKQTFITSPGKTFSGTFNIPEGKTSTTLSCELTATANTNLDIENTEFFKFKRVVLRYI